MSTPQSPAGLDHEIEQFRQLLVGTSVRAQRGLRASVVVAVVIWVGAAAWLWYTVSRVSSMEARRAQLAREVKHLVAVRDSLVRQRDTLLVTQGFSRERLQAGVRTHDVEMAAAATTARQNAAARGDAAERGNITVQVFSRDVDRSMVEASLRELGYRMTEQGPTAAVPSAAATNAIWYGSAVPLQDVKLVAYTLLRAGIDLYYVEPIRAPGREHVIQVGSVAGPPRRPTAFTVDEIKTATTFPATLHTPPARTTLPTSGRGVPTPAYRAPVQPAAGRDTYPARY